MFTHKMYLFVCKYLLLFLSCTMLSKLQQNGLPSFNVNMINDKTNNKLTSESKAEIILFPIFIVFRLVTGVHSPNYHGSNCRCACYLLSEQFPSVNEYN